MLASDLYDGAGLKFCSWCGYGAWEREAGQPRQPVPREQDKDGLLGKSNCVSSVCASVLMCALTDHRLTLRMSPRSAIAVTHRWSLCWRGVASRHAGDSTLVDVRASSHNHVLALVAFRARARACGGQTCEHRLCTNVRLFHTSPTTQILPKSVRLSVFAQGRDS